MTNFPLFLIPPKQCGFDKHELENVRVYLSQIRSHHVAVEARKRMLPDGDNERYYLYRIVFLLNAVQGDLETISWTYGEDKVACNITMAWLDKTFGRRQGGGL